MLNGAGEVGLEAGEDGLLRVVLALVVVVVVVLLRGWRPILLILVGPVLHLCGQKEG